MAICIVESYYKETEALKENKKKNEKLYHKEIKYLADWYFSSTYIHDFSSNVIVVQYVQ